MERFLLQRNSKIMFSISLFPEINWGKLCREYNNPLKPIMFCEQIELIEVLV